MNRTRRTAAPLGAALLLAALSLTACSDDASSADDSASPSAATGSGTPGEASSAPATESSTPVPSGTSIDITIKGGQVDPNGDRVDAEVGKPITLNIDAEKAGELHVHASPEQEIAFPAGKSVKKLTIDRPGIVEVEDHELEKVIVQLQVS